MLKQLRIRITLLAVLLTGAVLAGVLTIAYQITRTQYLDSRQLAFDATVDEVHYQWLQFGQLDDTRLSQLRSESGIRLYLEENAQPFLQSRHTDLAEVFDAAKEIAHQQYQLNSAVPPISGLSIQRADFPLESAGQNYRCSVRLSDFSAGKWTMLIAVQNTAPERAYCTRLALLFSAMAAGGLVVLCAACWFVAGRATQPIRDAMEQQQQFLSAAGHELCTPLAVIRANIGAARQQPQKVQRYLTTVDEECARMGSLVDELLLLSAGSSARQRFVPEVLAPDTLLLDFAEGMEPLAIAQNRRLQVELPDTAVPSVWGDAYRLRQLLTILVDNALRFAPEKSTILLRLCITRNRVQFWVIDRGPGIPNRDKKRIFQRFARLGNASENPHHFGLGLAVAAELAKLHDGKLWVEDTPNGGASFCLSLKEKKC